MESEMFSALPSASGRPGELLLGVGVLVKARRAC